MKKNSIAIIKNPTVVFEVLSPSTKSYDLSDKLEEYKTFESLEQLVFVYHDKMKVATYRRSYEPIGWLNQDFTKPEDTVEIEEKSLLLSDIYHKVIF